MTPLTLHQLGLPLALALAACSQGDGSDLALDENTGAGPCVHVYEDAVLHLDSASGRTTDAVIGQITLSDFAVDGTARTPDQVTAQQSQNVVVDGDTLVCTLPCAFGTDEGTWTFVSDADGYAPTPQSEDAAYATFNGGCPSSNDDGTHVTLQLDEDGG